MALWGNYWHKEASGAGQSLPIRPTIMTAGSVLLGIALLLVLLIFLARPFLEPTEVERPLTRREALRVQKETLLGQIQKLDFDFDTDKIPAEVHAFEREQLITQAAEVMRQIDELGTEPATGIDIEIEAAITHLRQKSAASTAAPVTAVTSLTNGKGYFCPQCGSPTGANDKFCAHCGHQLVLATQQPATS